MRKAIIFLFLSLLALEVSAQQYPERRQVRKGNRAFEKGNYQDAAGRYMRALGVAPGSFEAAYDLGNAYYRQEQYDQAVQTLQQVAADSLAAPADRAHAFYNLGNAQFQQKKYSEALESFKNSLRLNPDDVEAKFNYAYVKKLLDDQNQRNQNNQDKNNQNQNDRNKDNQNQNQNKDNQNQNQNQNQNKDNRNQDQDRNGGENQDQQDQENKSGDTPQNPDNGEGQPQPAGISQAEQERMLDAIQAQEDKTQEKLKEKAGAVVRLKKNW